MSDFLKNISFIGVSKTFIVAIREQLPKFGKNHILLVQVNEPEFSKNFKNKMS